MAGFRLQFVPDKAAFVNHIIIHLSCFTATNYDYTMIIEWQQEVLLMHS
jgi:hypothetical protein